MNIKSKNIQPNNNPWEAIVKPQTSAGQIEHDTQMLAFKFLGEIQTCQEILGINRKELAKKVGTSASYITQLYRGDKLPNLEILTKMAHALNIEFKISVKAEKGETVCTAEEAFLKSIHKFSVPGTSVWVRYNLTPSQDVYKEALNLKNISSNEIETIPA